MSMDCGKNRLAAKSLRRHTGFRVTRSLAVTGLATMTRDMFWKQFSALPPTSKKLVEELVSALGTSTAESPTAASTALTVKPLSKKRTSQPFVGMWRDRDEMADSAAWVRNQRQQEWNRSSG